jgi:hypothetical protein
MKSSCAALDTYQLVKLCLERVRMSRLIILNQKHHWECDDTRARIDNEHPGFGEMHYWPKHGPHNDYEATAQKRRRQSRQPRSPVSNLGKSLS